jgi:hypothetical protein
MPLQLWLQIYPADLFPASQGKHTNVAQHMRLHMFFPMEPETIIITHTKKEMF